MYRTSYWTSVASQNVLHSVPKGPDIKHDDMDAAKSSERMRAVFQLFKYVLVKKPVALYETHTQKVEMC